MFLLPQFATPSTHTLPPAEPDYPIHLLLQHFSAHFPLSLTRPLSTWWKTFSLFLELPLLLLLLLLPLMSFLLVVAEMGRPCSLRLQMALLRAAVLVAT